MQEVRQLFKNAAYLFVGSVVADVSAFLFKVILAQEFGPAEFGLFSLGLLTVTVATSVSLLGLPDGIVTFVSRFRSNSESNKIAGVLVTAGALSVGLSFGLVIFLWTFATPISLIVFSSPELPPILRVFLLAVPAKSIIALSGALCLSYERAGVQTMIQNVLPKTGILATATFVVFAGGDIQSLIWWYVTVLWLTAAFGVLVSYVLLRGEPVDGLKTNTKRLLVFSVPLFLSGFVGIFLNWTDTWLVSYYLTSTSVGIYQSAFLLGTSIAIFQVVIASSLYPDFGALLAEGRYQTIQKRFREGVKWIVIFTVAPVTYLVVFPDQSLSLLFGSEYSKGSVALVVIAAGQLGSVAVGPATNLLKTLKQSRYILVSTVAAVVINVALNVLLIPRYGMAGAAMATATGSISVNVLHLLKARQNLTIRVPIRVLGFTVCIGATTALLVRSIIGTVTALPTFAGHVALFSVLYAVGVVGIGLVNHREVLRLVRQW